MWRFADEDIGKFVFALFVVAAVVVATLVFLFANRTDEAWLAPQAEKAEQKAK